MLKLSSFLSICSLLALSTKFKIADAADGDFCKSLSGIPGVCGRIHRCVPVMDYFRQNGITLASKSFIKFYETCSGTKMVCCPDSILPNSVQITIPATSDPLSSNSHPINSLSLGDVKIPKTTNFVQLSRNLNLKLINKPMCGVVTADKVLFGNKTSVTEFPFMALLGFEHAFSELQWACGGSLINDRYVLTAAHCFGTHSTLKTVRLGEHTISTNVDCSIHDDEKICADPVQDIQVESFKIHENYNREKFANDIALVRLSKPANFNTNNVKPICLPTTDKTANQNLKNMIIAGWGQTEDQRSSDELLQASLPFVSTSDCKQIFARANKKVDLYDSLICAGGERADSYTNQQLLNTAIVSIADSVIGVSEIHYDCMGKPYKFLYERCRGDSGGPLMYFSHFNRLNRVVQYGVLAAGVDCIYADKKQKFPSIFMDVRYYMDWILNNIRE